MKKFLGKDGLTSTSANHIANIAKEMYESREASIESLCLVSRHYTLAVNGNTYQLSTESTKKHFSSIEESLKEIASLKSLIAWLREGIKAKQYEMSSQRETEWVQEQIKQGRKELEYPQSERTVTFEDVLSDEPIDRQARYYALEAKCATMGKYIHPGGHISNARAQFFAKKINPTEIKGSGQEAEINKYSSTYTEEEVNESFFKLQQEYRSVQAEFNGLKSEIESAVDEINKKKYAEFAEERQRHSLALKAALLERSVDVKALKIIIPDALKPIYEKVAKVASAKLG